MTNAMRTFSALTEFRVEIADCKPHGVSPPKSPLFDKIKPSKLWSENLLCQLWLLRIFTYF